MHDQPAIPTSRRAGFLIPVILIGIVLLGGYLRFNGLNWDDFSALHPDERFLTRNLLPLIGGTLEFTDDGGLAEKQRFPSQSILIGASAPYTSRFDLQVNSDVRIGVLKDSPLSRNIAVSIAGEERVIVYDSPDQALSDLLNNIVRALIVKETESPIYGVSVRRLETIPSTSLQMLSCQARYPETNGIGGYFDADCSPLNPHNAGAGFYAYGTLPLFIAHFASEFVQDQEAAALAQYGDQQQYQQDGTPPPATFFSFQGGPVVWRFFSALFDVGTIFLVFLIGTRLHHYRLGLLAALLYAAMPLAIQKAHYGTVNAITTFFVALAVWAAARVQDKGRWIDFIIFGIGLGAAVSGRINTVPLAALIVIAASLYCAPGLDGRLAWPVRQRLWQRAILGVILAAIFSAITFRLCNPYAFVGPGILGVTPNPRFFADLVSAQQGISGYQDSPPNWQWIARPAYLYPLKDMFLWGMGVVAATLAWIGVLWTGYRLVTGKPLSTRNLLIWVWTVGYFAWMGRQWVMTMRYYLPLYPTLALLAAWTAYECVRLARLRGHEIPLTRILLSAFAVVFGLIPVYYLANGLELTFTAGAAGIAAILLFAAAWVPGLGIQRSRILVGTAAAFTVLWGLMFTNIYRHQLSRVQAARYVSEQVSGDFSMQVEGAPEGTPLINIAIFNSNPISSPDIATLATSPTVLANRTPYLFEFTAPETGTISQVYSPHIGDFENDPDAETLYVSIAPVGASEPLATGTLSLDFQRATHVLGEAYTIPLSRPVTVKKGQRYSFKAEALEGTITTAGAVVVAEGTWDDRITEAKICQLPEGKTLKDDVPPGSVGYRDCEGDEAYPDLVQSFDQVMSYPIDDAGKLNNIIESLHAGDYIGITSNRFYDSESRNRLMWPLTTRYYDLLFAGELGYDVVQVFNESYELGPLSVSDQHLPIYDSPVWFNEYEADEAFHVYDHPAVFLLKKRADYDPQRVEFLLREVPLTKTDEIVYETSGPGSTVIGVVRRTSVDAAKAPTGLMLSPDLVLVQQQGGTWRERFDSGSVLNTNQPLGVAVWWVVIMAFGWLAFPLTFAVFPRLADRGYSVSKFVGILLVAWLGWVLSSVRIPVWSQGGLLLCVAIIAAVSVGVAWRKRRELGSHIRSHIGQIIVIEVLALVLFIAFIGVRLTNPDLWHFAKGGEKPMDFAMFNAVLRSTVFPPYDAWFSGGFINYYYFGYVFISAPVLILKIVPAFAYNLVIPTLFSLVGMAAFSVSFNVVAHWRDRPRVALDGTERPGARYGSAWLAGISAIILCVVLGNLDTIRVFGTGLAQLGGYEIPTGVETFLRQQYFDSYGTIPPDNVAAEFAMRGANPSLGDRLSYEINNSVSLVVSLFRGIPLMGNGLPIGSDRWYWAASRVYAETPEVGGYAITEMPFFTFVYGDLHAHMMSMPFMLFVMLFVWHELAVVGDDQRSWRSRLGAIALGALASGLLRAVNTWDWPTFTALSVLGLGYAWWLRWKLSIREFYPLQLLVAAIVVVIVEFILWLIINHFGLPSLLLLIAPAVLVVGYGGVIIAENFDRSSIVDILAQNSAFMIFNAAVALPFTTWFASNYNSVQPWTGGKAPLWAYFDIHGVFLFFVFCLFIWETGRWLRSVKVKDLRGRFTPAAIFGFVVGIVLLSALVAMIIGYQVALFVLPLVLWGAVLFFRPGQSRAMQFVIVLVCLALTLTLFVEVLVLSGDIDRQNTVFKFYIQVWLIFSVAGGAAVAWLFQASEDWSVGLKSLFYLPGLVLVLVAAMYPIMATRARSMDRMTPNLPLTLNGLDYMLDAEHSLMDYGITIPLRGDYALIRWLQENVDGSPVIMEGRSIASEYRWNGRISINTGLPSVLGWAHHQRQQRTLEPLPELVNHREQNVKFFYNTSSIPDAVRLLRYYDVRYIIVSDMERVMTTNEGLNKFDQMVDQGLLTIAFQDGPAVIYEVNHEALDRYAFAQYQQGVLP